MLARLHCDAAGGHAAHAALAQRGQRGLVARAVRQQGRPEPLQRRPGRAWTVRPQLGVPVARHPNISSHREQSKPGQQQQQLPSWVAPCPLCCWETTCRWWSRDWGIIPTYPWIVTVSLQPGTHLRMLSTPMQLPSLTSVGSSSAPPSRSGATSRPNTPAPPLPPVRLLHRHDTDVTHRLHFVRHSPNRHTRAANLCFVWVITKEELEAAPASLEACQSCMTQQRLAAFLARWVLRGSYT